MQKFLNVLLIATAVSIFSGTAVAQYGPTGGPYQPDAVSALIGKVHTDLNRGYDVWKLSKGDRERLNDAEKQLREFDHDWSLPP